MKQIHLPSPAAGPHQPCRPIDGCWLIVSGGTATAAKRSTTPLMTPATLPTVSG
jgi:hypothetical protein